jgi:hypothetical protein
MEGLEAAEHIAERIIICVLLSELGFSEREH